MEEKGLNQIIRRKRSRAGKFGPKTRNLFNKRGKNLRGNVNANDNKLDRRKNPLRLEKLKLKKKPGRKPNKNLDTTEANENDRFLDDKKIKNKIKVDDFMIYEYDQSVSIKSLNVEDFVKGNSENQQEVFIKEDAEEKMEFLNEDIFNSESDDETLFSKILEVDDEEYKIVPNIKVEQSSSLNTNLNTLTFQAISETNSLEKENFNKIFSLEKINNKSKFIKDSKINDGSEFTNEDEKNSYHENFSLFNNNLNRTSNINFNTYKPQIKINNYFIRHKSTQLNNSTQNQEDINNKTRFLTKPCIICEKARFAKNELLKLQTCEEFMLSFKYFIKQAELKIEQKTFNTANLQTFNDNKKLYEEFFDENYKCDPNSLKKNFRRGKRICVDCFQNHIEKKPLGTKELLELIKEEDEQAELDEGKRNEIFSEIKKFMYMNGYDVDKNFPIFSNSVNLTQENFNIFNMIFSRKGKEESTNKITHMINFYSPNNTNFNSNRTKISEVNNSLPNLSNFNDKPKPSNKGGFPKDKLSFCNVSSILNEQPVKQLYDVDMNESHIEMHARPIEILKSQCEFIKNVMTFEQLVMLQTMKSVDDYMIKLTILSKNIQASVNFLSKMVKIYREKKSDLQNNDRNINGNEKNKDNETNHFLLKNLNENLQEKNENKAIVNSLEQGQWQYDEKTILDNLEKLLNLNKRVTDLLILFKTIMNYFSNYFPFFCRIVTGNSFSNILNTLVKYGNTKLNSTNEKEEKLDNSNNNFEEQKIPEVMGENAISNHNEDLNQNINSFEKINSNEIKNLNNNTQENLISSEVLADANKTQNDPLTFPLRPVFVKLSNEKI